MAEAIQLVSQPDTVSHAQAIMEQGFTYFPNELSLEEISQLRSAMDRLTAKPESFDKIPDPAEHGFMEKSINNAFNRDPVFAEYLDRTGIIDVAEAVLGEDCHCIGMTAWVTGPGRPDQALHADFQPLTLPEDIMADERVQIPVFISTLHFYLDDIYPEIGPTNFVPGSHRAGRPPLPDEVNWQGKLEQSIFCNAGDAVLFRSEVWHRGTANSSNQTRYLLQVHYAKRIITQKFPPYLYQFSLDEDLIKNASPRQLRLLGDHRPSNYD